jgi:hypothetical protein
MKAIIQTLIIILASFSASAQQNFIELTVSETIQVNAIEFTYEVSVGGTSAYDMMMDEYEHNYDEDEDEIEVIEPTIEEVAKSLLDAKFSVEPSNVNLYTVSSNKKQSSLMVTVKNVDELKRLTETVKNIEGASGKIIDTKFEEASVYYSASYPRLMALAKKRADLLATTSGKKAGGVIQVSEGRLSNTATGDTWSNYMTSIMEMASMMEGKKFVSTKNEVIALTYRFELIN